MMLVALVGIVLGVLLGGHTTHKVGPFESSFILTPAFQGDTVVGIPPLGALTLDSHDGPVRLNVTLDRLRQADARRLLDKPAGLKDIGDQAAHDVRGALLTLALRTSLAALLGALALGLLVFRSLRRALLTGAMSLVLLGATGGVAALTWDPAALREPTYSGLLTNAPALIGNARDITARFDIYRRELASLVTNVSRLYAAASTLSAYQPDSATIRVLHVSDLHLNPSAWGVINSIVKQFKIDVIVDTGDLTDHGSAAETGFADEIGKLGVPYVTIRGNHDSAQIMAAVARQRDAVVLDGTEHEVAGVAFAGIGDPRFTPDKDTREAKSDDSVVAAGEALAADARGFPRTPDVFLVHDPKTAGPLAGLAPLVLAGHLHKRSVRHLDGATLLLVQGSTGGAGLRGVEKERPTPLECSVLYLDADSHHLRAYDNITLGGLGESTVTIDRTVVDPTERSTP